MVILCDPKSQQGFTVTRQNKAGVAKQLAKQPHASIIHLTETRLQNRHLNILRYMCAGVAQSV